MKYGLLAVGLLVLAGCGFAGEPNWRNVWPVTVEDWRIPPPNYEHQVSRPLKYEELPDYVESMTQSGWDIVDTEPAGPEFPTRYLVVTRRFK